MSMLLTYERLSVLLTTPKSEEVSLPSLLQSLFERGYTGRVVFHFQGGKPRVVEFEPPQVRLSS